LSKGGNCVRDPLRVPVGGRGKQKKSSRGDRGAEVGQNEKKKKKRGTDTYLLARGEVKTVNKRKKKKNGKKLAELRRPFVPTTLRLSYNQEQTAKEWVGGVADEKKQGWPTVQKITEKTLQTRGG